MKDYWRGILVRILRSGESTSGRIYDETALHEVAALINRRGSVPCYLGHGRPATYMGRIAFAEVAGDAVWGALCGIEPRELMAINEGVKARGISCVGLSILADGIVVPDGDKKHVRHISAVESVDFCSRSTPEPAAGGLVPFDEHGWPIGWEERQQYFYLLEAAHEIIEAKRAPSPPRSAPARSAPAPARRTMPPSLEEIAGKIVGLLESVGQTTMTVESVYLDRVVLNNGGRLFMTPYRATEHGGVDFHGALQEVQRVFVPKDPVRSEPAHHAYLAEARS